MINPDTLTRVGKFGRPHGLAGELTATFECDLEPAPGLCLVVEMDGLMVPFFVESSRPKGTETWLLRLDGVDTEARVRSLVNQDIYLEPHHMPEIDDDDDRVYLEDLVDYLGLDDKGDKLGRITGVDERTANALFLFDTGLMIPAVDEYITDIDHDNKTITFALPEGLTSMNEKD